MVTSRVRPARLGRANLSASTCLAAFVSGLVLTLTPLHASSAKFFRTSTQAAFLKGDIDNLAINSRGELVLGPGTELVYETAAPFLWSMLAASDGTLLVGTGNEGKVFQVDPQGDGSLFFHSAELEVHALAAGPDGSIYVGTSPDGKIYKVDRNGTVSDFFDPDTKYIWALAVDSKGNLYAGTGEKGVVYKITPDGKGTTFYKTNTTHATALAFDQAGNLLVGTGMTGKVLRIDPDGKPFVLLDTPFQEIRALHFDDNGMLYAVALSGPAPGGRAPVVSDTFSGDRGPADSSRPVATVTAEITSVSVGDAASGAPSSGPARESRLAPRGAVYRIAADGASDQIWESREESPYDIAFDQNGAVIVGTGNKGKIYRLEGEPPRATLLARASAQQITAFHRDARGHLYCATANPGKVFRLSPERAARGTYISEPKDAGTVSTWGALSWRGTAADGNRIELFTRSGNTETPDETWSAWSGAYTRAEGSSIVSPKARYLQWRAVLSGTGEGPVLTSVTVAYLQRNLRPQVRSITVYPPGVVFQKPFTAGDPELAGFDNQTTPERKIAAAAATQSSSTSPSLGRRTYQKGLQTLIWKADDENDDELVYDVLYRREGEVTWKPLRRGISDTILVWDTTTVPDGTYFVKIVASDSPSNTAGTALSGELESATFEVDNTPPRIVTGGVRVDSGRTIVVFDVKDDTSTIQRVEYSQDGLKWRSVFPTDGIADSREEHYQVTIEGELGERGLTLRASDAMDNVATTHVDAPTGR